jgi:hypothetical protein
MSSLKTSVMTGTKVVVKGEVALTASGEVGTEGTALVSDLNDQGPDVRRLSEGLAALCRGSGHGDRPGVLLLLGHVLPWRLSGGVGGTVGFVGSSCAAFERASHMSMMPEGQGQRPLRDLQEAKSRQPGVARSWASRREPERQAVAAAVLLRTDHQDVPRGSSKGGSLKVSADITESQSHLGSGGEAIGADWGACLEEKRGQVGAEIGADGPRIDHR